MEKRYEALKEALSSFKFDYMLNKTVALCEHCELCNDVDVKVKNEPWFKFFCYQFARNIQTLYNIIRLSYVLKEERCNTLTYWIHDKVTNFYDKPNINVKNVDIFSEILKVWGNINSRKYNNDRYTCKIPGKEEPKNLGEMKRKKIMSDYCENYDTLKSLLTRNIHVNCHIYYDYFKESFLEFSENVKDHEEQCSRISKCNRFCNRYDPDDLLSKSKCKIIQISNDNKEYIKQEECDELKREAVSAVICESKEVQIPQFTFSDNRAIILILFSLWGIFLSFLFLYKITPVRSWISNKLRKKKIIRDSFHEESDNESLDADYENIDRNMQNVGYNISYNSDWNSTQ
ncbi:PIR Superfamily Protein [Plasmodium ovale wallikeri]|uniref:PIR Superfamily Protein n=1 Tax=Plasmodium ovale wallikeri TaxID=864142 RepID=A0A1A9AL93_PLAOA|nr:PIR Superfamily Protein [Plasmodium ovale wallikeri]SBT59422.1 PIR Superfamily Protein [Plasmodium ovale wallikeri]